MRLNYTLTAPDLNKFDIMIAVEGAVLRTAQQCVDDARGFAPVRTGFLRSTIQQENQIVTTSSASVDVVANASYAGFVEFGHMTREGPHRRFVPAQPFMGPAAQLAEQNLIRNVQTNVELRSSAASGV